VAIFLAAPLVRFKYSLSHGRVKFSRHWAGPMARALLLNASVSLARGRSLLTSFSKAKITTRPCRTHRRALVLSAASDQEHRPCIVLSNDDGCESPLLTRLYHALRERVPELEVVRMPAGT
jgi:hypothetical protein